MHDAPIKPLRPDALTPEAALDLTRAILARTSGSPCARVRDLACAYVDGELESARQGLVAGHLEHCEACAQVVTALTRATALLPRMAEADPGPWFTARVLRATVHAPRRPAFDGWAAWVGLLHRPRIALEAAYLGTALSFMGLALPLPASLGSPRTLLRNLSPDPLVAPLKAPAERVLGPLVAAERRTAASVQRALKLGAAPSQGEAAKKTPWQRASMRLRGWWRALRGLPPENTAAPPNP